MNQPSGCVTLHSSRSPFAAGDELPCILNVSEKKKTTISCRLCLLALSGAAALSPHVQSETITCNKIACSVLTVPRVRQMEGIRVGCMSRVGLNRPLVADWLSFLPGSGHSSSISYPMSLCSWDKVLFVCPWLLARAHRALKLRL